MNFANRRRSIIACLLPATKQRLAARKISAVGYCKWQPGLDTKLFSISFAYALNSVLILLTAPGPSNSNDGNQFDIIIIKYLFTDFSYTAA